MVGRCPLTLCTTLLFLAGCSDPVLDLARQLQSTDVDVRRSTARSLGEMGPEAATAVGLIESSLTDDDPQVRRLSCWALGRIGVRDEHTQESLRRRLEDDELAVKMAAAFALQQLAAG